MGSWSVTVQESCKLGVGDATAWSALWDAHRRAPLTAFHEVCGVSICASRISARLRAHASEMARVSDLYANSARRHEHANSTARFALSAIAA